MKFVKTITILMTFCVMAFANMDRVNALGGNPGFWPDDDANVSAFPAMVNNLDMVQVSGAGSDGGVATVIWGEGTTWGFSFDGTGSDAGSDDWINLMWGNGTYGATFSLGSGSYDNGLSGDDNITASSFGLAAGFGMNMDFGELGVTFSQGSSDDGDDSTDEEGTFGLGVNLRRAQNVWLFDNMLVNFSMANTSNYDDVKDAKNDDMNLSVDLFTSLPAGDGVNATFAMGFGYESNTLNEAGTGDDVASSVITLPSVSLGVEAEVTDWATVRFGMGHAYVLSGSNGDETWTGAFHWEEATMWMDNTTGEEVEAGCEDCTSMTYDAPVSNFNWNFGLGFDYGSFTLDMVLDNTNLFNDPVRYITGRNDNGLSSSATLTWKF